MATIEQNGLMQFRDGSGNMYLLYPITKAALVDGLDEALRSAGNPNMLRDGYFAKPVNQRGQTEYTATSTAWVHTVDGWKMMTATLTVGDGFCNFTAPDETVYKRITQLTEQTLKAGETYTLSMLAQVNDIGGTANFRPCAADYGPVKGVQGKFIAATDEAPALYTYTFTPTADAVNAGVEILIDNAAGCYIDMDIYAIKLERGGIQTLAHQDSGGNWVLNEIPDYNEELLRCCMSTADSSDTYANNAKTPDAINAANKNSVHLLDDRGTLIPDGSDLDDYTTPGNYYVPASTNAATLTNAPTTSSGFRLIVDYGYGGAYPIRQKAVMNTYAQEIYRAKTSTGWSSWRRVATTEDAVSKAGDTMKGSLIAHNDTNYSAYKVRNAAILSATPSTMSNGTVAFVYK